MDLPEPHAGAGEVRISVRAAGVNASDWKKRLGQMDQELPQTMGYEAAGVVDEIGSDVTGVQLGDEVVGFGGDGAAQAEYAVLSTWAPIPESLGFVGAAALPSTVETAARALVSEPSRSPTVRAWPIGSGRSFPTGSTWRSTSRAAASCRS